LPETELPGKKRAPSPGPPERVKGKSDHVHNGCTMPAGFFRVTHVMACLT